MGKMTIRQVEDRLAAEAHKDLDLQDAALAAHAIRLAQETERLIRDVSRVVGRTPHADEPRKGREPQCHLDGLVFGLSSKGAVCVVLDCPVCEYDAAYPFGTLAELGGLLANHAADPRCGSCVRQDRSSKRDAAYPVTSHSEKD